MKPQIIDHISELSALLKTVYGDAVVNQQNLAAMLYKRFGQSKVTFGGNCYEFPARMGNAQSVGARGYRQGLPQPIMTNDQTCRIRHKFNYGTFDIAGPDIEKGKGNVNAFVNTLTDKMRNLTEMMQKDLNMQMYLDGTGVRATLTSTVTAGAFTVDTVKYLRQNMQVNGISGVDGVTIRGGNGDSDPGDGAGSTYNAKRFTIIDIDATTLTVTLGLDDGTAVSPTGLTTGDYLARHKAIGSELTGLGAIVDNGTNNPGALVLQDIDRSIARLWRATVLTLAGGLTNNDMQHGIDIPEIISGKKIDTVVGSFNSRDAYLVTLVPQKRFTDLKLDGGFQVLEYNGRDFLVDVDCQDDRIYFLNRASLEKFGLFELAFVEQTGGILKHDSLASGDVFYGFLRTICNFGTYQANANAVITNIPVDSVYSAIAA